MAFLLFSCIQKKKDKDKAFDTFNEGVSLNLSAIEEQNKGNFEKADSLNKQSIEKFRETLKLDSSHGLARSTLGHSLYIDRQFKEAIYWFEQANKVDGELAVNFREMGLCKVNIGLMQEGRNDIDRAFIIDTTKEIRGITVQDLVGIGEHIFQYSTGYAQQGESDRANEYRKYSIGVLMIAFEYDQSRKDIASRIAEFAAQIGDKKTAEIYNNLGGQ